MQNAKIPIHPAHAQSFIQVFALCWYILLYQTILWHAADSEGPDQIARMLFAARAM